MKISKFFTVFFIFTMILIFTEKLQAQIGVGPTLNTSFCDQPSFRETVVYIDDLFIIDEKTEWAEKLLSKLSATLMPGERVTLVQLSPASGQSKSVWTGCWPEFTQARLREISKEFYIFSQDPRDQLVEQKQLFQAYFAQAVSKIYRESKRPLSQVRFLPENAPKKQILRAIASDDGRYANNQKTIRVIIYSDMMENSDLGSVYREIPDKTPNYGEKLGSRFRKTVFYAFGIAGDVDNAGGLTEKVKIFWSRALTTMNAVIVGFGSDLTIKNQVPYQYYKFNIKTKILENNLEGEMLLILDSDGVLLDSMIGFDRISIVPIIGKFRCDGDLCTLDASTTQGLVTKTDSDSVSLSGHLAEMVGKIGVRSSDKIFEIIARNSSITQ